MLILYFEGGNRGLESETHTKRQATQHGFLPSLLANGDKVFKIVYGALGEKVF